jgi:PAS domain-containing protein
MKKFLLSLIRSNQSKVDLKTLQDDERLNKVNESYAAFLNAAGDTLTLAQDVTISLRDKIDDYTNQIEATSQVIPDALILVGSDGRIENINVAAERIFGHTRIEVFKKTLADLFVDPNAKVTLKKLKSIYSNKSNSFERLMNGATLQECIRTRLSPAQMPWVFRTKKLERAQQRLESTESQHFPEKIFVLGLDKWTAPTI